MEHAIALNKSGLLSSDLGSVASPTHPISVKMRPNLFLGYPQKIGIVQT
jgi:hypothetical protein